MTDAAVPPVRNSRLDRLLDGFDRLVDQLAEPSGFAVAVIGYYVVALLIRTLVLIGSSGDEAQLMQYGQGFAWIYDPGNPPMAGWLGALAERVLGPSLAVALVVRYGLLVAFLLIGHAAAREVFSDRRTALAAAISAFGFWFFGWEALRNYMDSLVLIAAIAATVWLMLRLARAPSLFGYAGLTLAVAAGTLGKFSYPPVLACLVAAAGVDNGLRAALWSRRGLVAMATGLVLGLPPYLWVAFHLDRWLPLATDRLVTSALPDNAVNGIADRALLVPEAALAFSLPLLPLFVLAFAPELLRLGAFRGQNRPVASPERRRVRRWLGAAGLLLGLLGTVVVLSTGMEKLREHYMFVLMPLPLLLFALLPPGPLPRRRAAAYCGALAVLAVVALAVLTGQGVAEAFGCTKCRMIMPWRVYAEKLQEAGFTRGTIVSYDSPFIDIGSNLRRYLPDTRVVNDKRPFYIPPPLERPGDCLLVWDDTRFPQIAIELRTLPIPHIGVPVPEGTPFGRMEAPLVGASAPATAVGYAIVKGGLGDCR